MRVTCLTVSSEPDSEAGLRETAHSGLRAR